MRSVLPRCPNCCSACSTAKSTNSKRQAAIATFHRGGVTSGVTAASAIAALQEAGGKLTRDMVRGGYRAFAELNRIVIELIRQFYDEPRFFRVVGEGGEEEYLSYSNAALRTSPIGSIGEELAARRPVFDIRVSAEKANPFSQLSQNELALQLYNAGFFSPELREQALAALSMMNFEGKAALEARLSGATP